MCLLCSKERVWNDAGRAQGEAVWNVVYHLLETVLYFSAGSNAKLLNAVGKGSIVSVLKPMIFTFRFG